MDAPSSEHLNQALVKNDHTTSDDLKDLSMKLYRTDLLCDTKKWQFDIQGAENQVLELCVEPGYGLYSETGLLMHMEQGFDRDVSSAGGCCQALLRCCCASEGFFRESYINNTNDPLIIALTPKYPSKLVPVDMSRHSGITIQSGSFFCSTEKDISIKVRYTGKISTGCCGGMGFLLNSVHGKGLIFLNAGGTILEKHLAPGEVIHVSADVILAFDKTVQFSARINGSCRVFCCSQASTVGLTGPGLVLLQSMSKRKLISNMHPAAS